MNVYVRATPPAGAPLWLESAVVAWLVGRRKHEGTWELRRCRPFGYKAPRHALVAGGGEVRNKIFPRFHCRLQLFVSSGHSLGYAHLEDLPTCFQWG